MIQMSFSKNSSYDETLQNGSLSCIPHVNALQQKDETFNQKSLLYPIYGREETKNKNIRCERLAYYEKYCDKPDRCDFRESYFSTRVTSTEPLVEPDSGAKRDELQRLQSSSSRSVLSQERVENFSKPKKVKKKAKTERRIAVLQKPLSELTKDLTHIHILDIESYVNRSSEERHREVDHDNKIPGRVKRPMNSFMLYRKAYQNRAKFWCSLNNHQVVSRVCGESWPLEPDSIKEQFKGWARVERHNHQDAFPQYKFSPSKPAIAKSAAKRKISVAPASDESELEEYSWRERQRNEFHVDNCSKSQITAETVSYFDPKAAQSYTSRECAAELNSKKPSRQRSPFQESYNYQKSIVPYDAVRLEAAELYQDKIQGNELTPGDQNINFKQINVSDLNFHAEDFMEGEQMYNLQEQLNEYPYRSYTQVGNMDPNLLNLYGIAGTTTCPGDYFSQVFYTDHETQVRRNCGIPRYVELKEQESFLQPELDYLGAETRDYFHNEEKYYDEWPAQTMEHGEFVRLMESE